MTDPFTTAVAATQAAQQAAAQLAQENTTLTQQHAADQATIAAIRPELYTVRPGDTLSGIAKTQGILGGDWHSIVGWNALTSTTIRPGQSLLLLVTSAQPQPQPTPQPSTTTAFGIDLSDLTTDKPLTEAQKVDAHRALGLHLTNVRVFFGSRVPTWTDERIRALDPTRGDSITVSTLSRDTAGLAAWLKNTPDVWRGHVDLTHGHEREADLFAQPDPDAAIADWLAGCQEKADLLDAASAQGYSADNFGKIMLHYTQHHGPTAQRDSYERFHGGQDFGWIGEDCYHYAAWLNGGDRYETPDELFGGIVSFCQQAGRPCRIPEWGSTLAHTDTDGSRRAQAITDGGTYLKAHGVLSANWWCGSGSSDKTQPTGVRVFHLEGTPALAAYLAL